MDHHNHHHQQQKFYSDAQEELVDESELHVDDYVVVDDGINLELENLRKRKGKIIASAKETIENGEWIFFYKRNKYFPQVRLECNEIWVIEYLFLVTMVKYSRSF